MMAKARKLISIALVGAVALSSWWVGSRLWGDTDEALGTEHLVNQIWIERMPADPRDMVGHVVLIEHPQGKLGVVGRSSTWRHFNELFLWRLRANRLDTKFPQDRVKGSAEVRTWRCEGEAPEPFELCLEVGHGGHSALLYSRYDWVVRPHDGESLRTLAQADPVLAGILATLPSDGPLVEDFDAGEDARDWADSSLLPPLLD